MNPHNSGFDIKDFRNPSIPEKLEEWVEDHLAKTCQVVANLSRSAIVQILNVFKQAYLSRRLVLIAGNGGSAATACHMANDLAKTVANGSAFGFRALSLTDNQSLLTAIGNDISFDVVFSHQIKTLGTAGDILIVLSGSGNSSNIIEALRTAREIGMVTIALLGREGGKARGMAEIELIVPSQEYGFIEDTHLILNHLMTDYLRQWVEKQPCT